MFQSIRRCDQFVEAEARPGLFGDGIPDMRVCVDERRKHDGVAFGLFFLYRGDLAVFDNDSALDRFELATLENRPF